MYSDGTVIVVYPGLTELKFIQGNGTYFPEKPVGDQKDLSLRELQELVGSLVDRVERLERHHAQY